VNPGLTSAAVWRELPLEAAPVRLRRGLASPAPTPAMPPEEEGFQRGYAQGLDEGRAQGLLEGHEEGLRQGQAEAAQAARAQAAEAVAAALLPLQERQQQVLALAQALEQALPQALDAAEEEMVALVFEALCRMIGAAGPNPASVQAQVAALLAQARLEPPLEVCVHPQDAALLAACPAQSGQTANWRADPQVALGGCVVRTRAGGLDLRLETLLQGCKEALLATRARRATQESAS
jgi:flagellar assembly protein FliH